MIANISPLELFVLWPCPLIWALKSPAKIVCLLGASALEVAMNAARSAKKCSLVSLFDHSVGAYTTIMRRSPIMPAISLSVEWWSCLTYSTAL